MTYIFSQLQRIVLRLYLKGDSRSVQTGRCNDSSWQSSLAIHLGEGGDKDGSVDSGDLVCPPRPQADVRVVLHDLVLSPSHLGLAAKDDNGVNVRDHCWLKDENQL